MHFHCNFTAHICSVVVGEQGNEHTSVSTCMLSQRPRIDLNERSLHRTMTNACYENPQKGQQALHL